ncbi:hypothetical protein Hanom_Chr16g01417241 [Helianthus anomalus]
MNQFPASFSICFPSFIVSFRLLDEPECLPESIWVSFNSLLVVSVAALIDTMLVMA